MTLDGWPSKTIGELCNFSNGYGFRPPDWSKEGLPIIRIQNLNGSKEFNYFNGIPDESWLVEPGTILFAWAGMPGVSFGPAIWSGPRGVLNQHIYRIHPHKEVNPLWLYAALEIATKNIERNAHGFKATLLHVRKEEITSQVVHFPPLCEQQKIVTVLSDTDSLIESLDKLIAKKRNIKQATMQQLLTGKTRLPGFAGNGSAKLGDFFELNPNKTYLNDTDLVTFIRMEDISESGYIINQNIMPLSSIKKGLTFFECNDVLVAKITPCFENGKGACLDTIETKSGFGSTEFHVLRAKKNAIPRYIFYQTQAVEFRQRLEAEMIGTAGQKRVPARAIINYSLPVLHSIDEQQAIAAILSDMDAEIAALEQKSNKTRALKQGMMQELLTGKTKLV